MKEMMNVNKQIGKGEFINTIKELLMGSDPREFLKAGDTIKFIEVLLHDDGGPSDMLLFTTDEGEYLIILLADMIAGPTANTLFKFDEENSISFYDWYEYMGKSERGINLKVLR